MFGVHNSSYRFFFCDKKRPTEISRISFKKMCICTHHMNVPAKNINFFLKSYANNIYIYVYF